MSCHLQLSNTPENFEAGKIAEFYHAWQQLSFDRNVLQLVRGMKIDFKNNISQLYHPRPMQFSQSEKILISCELEKLLVKKVIQEVVSCKGQYISNIFLRPKKDGSHRVILNLKKLNEDISYHHFKMDTFQAAVQLVRPNCWFSSADLKDAYFSVNIHPDFRKYLRFIWQDRIFEFTCLPQGLSEAPGKFTMLLKVLLSQLRKQGVTIIGYIDDTLIIEASQDSCMRSTQQAITLFDSCDLTVHPSKSVFEPVQSIKYLGFIICSVSMTVTLPQDKREKIHSPTTKFLDKRSAVTVRQFAELIGLLIASEPGVEFAMLHIKQLEIDKDRALKHNKGSYDGFIQISDKSHAHLLWWQKYIFVSSKSILKPRPDFVIQSDSSDFGWGAFCEGVTAGGPWTKAERDLHINVKELMAAKLALLAFCKTLSNITVKLEVDNTVTQAYIVHQGGRIQCLNDIVQEIYEFLNSRNIKVVCAHLPGLENIHSDKASGLKYDYDKEWQLKPDIFLKVEHGFGPFDVDLFASRINKLMDRFISWKPDPYAYAIDAFSVSWNGFINAYAFPPFSVISRVLQKIRDDKAAVTLVAPVWPTQAWFTQLLHLCVTIPKLLPAHQCVQLPSRPSSSAPINPQTSSCGLQIIRSALLLQGIPEESHRLLMQS